MKNIRLNIILMIVIVVLSGVAYYLYDKQSNDIRITKDPDSNTQSSQVNPKLTPEIVKGAKTRIRITVNESLFDKGLDANEFIAMNRAFTKTIKNIYGDKYNYGAVIEKTVAYNKDTDTYLFSIRLGDPGSDLIFKVRIHRVKFNIVEIKIIDSSGKTINKSQEKINTRL